MHFGIDEMMKKWKSNKFVFNPERTHLEGENSFHIKVYLKERSLTVAVAGLQM